MKNYTVVVAVEKLLVPVVVRADSVGAAAEAAAVATGSTEVRGVFLR